MRHGLEICEHLMYPKRYFVKQYGEALNGTGKKPMRKLSLRTAQKRVEQLIAKIERTRTR